MPRAQVKLLAHALGLVLLLATAVDMASDALTSDLLSKKLDFPSPVQWKVQEIEVSMIGVAWGPANSPEMVSRSREDVHIQKPEFYPDRSYVLALNFRARVPNVISSSMSASSGLALVKNVDGDIEAPMELTQSGFVPFSGSPGVFDIRFNRSSTTEHWDLFPVSSGQKEFLFEVFSNSNFMAGGGASKASFKIIRKDDDFTIINASPVGDASCLAFSRSFAGSVGPNNRLALQLTRHNAALSGTEQYLRIGTTLWLEGSADSLGNVVIEERYPKEVVTGIFKGAFSPGCRDISGLFSKPDGSRLQPFEFHEVNASPKPAETGPGVTPQ
jgi:hypothetical protein